MMIGGKRQMLSNGAVLDSDDAQRQIKTTAGDVSFIGSFSEFTMIVQVLSSKLGC